LAVYFVGLHAIVMIDRDSWGYSYLIVRGEILGFMKDELLVSQPMRATGAACSPCARRTNIALSAVVSLSGALSSVLIHISCDSCFFARGLMPRD
jgi:hypothetical protein